MTMREKLLAGIVAGLRAGAVDGDGVVDAEGSAWTGIDGHFDLNVVADAVLDALMEPDEGMIEAGNRVAVVEIEWCCAWSEDSYCETSPEPFNDAANVWQAMLTAALSGG